MCVNFIVSVAVLHSTSRINVLKVYVFFADGHDLISYSILFVNLKSTFAISQVKLFPPPCHALQARHKI